MLRPTALLFALLFALLATLTPAQPAGAQPVAHARKLGEFQAWIAATHGQGTDKICYAFTRARSIEGVPGRSANNVLLMVTHRRQGRDQVAVQSGYAYARNAEVPVTVGDATLSFYGAQQSAFARDNRAAVAAFRAGREAVVRGPGPNRHR